MERDGAVRENDALREKVDVMAKEKEDVSKRLGVVVANVTSLTKEKDDAKKELKEVKQENLELKEEMVSQISLLILSVSHP